MAAIVSGNSTSAETISWLSGRPGFLGRVVSTDLGRWQSSCSSFDARPSRHNRQAATGISQHNSSPSVSLPIEVKVCAPLSALSPLSLHATHIKQHIPGLTPSALCGGQFHSSRPETTVLPSHHLDSRGCGSGPARPPLLASLHLSIAFRQSRQKGSRKYSAPSPVLPPLPPFTPRQRDPCPSGKARPSLATTHSVEKESRSTQTTGPRPSSQT